MTRVIGAITLVLVAFAAGCGGKVERDRTEAWGSTDGEDAEATPPACQEAEDCAVGERCQDDVCVTDPARGRGAHHPCQL